MIRAGEITWRSPSSARLQVDTTDDSLKEADFGLILQKGIYSVEREPAGGQWEDYWLRKTLLSWLRQMTTCVPFRLRLRARQANVGQLRIHAGRGRKSELVHLFERGANEQGL